MQETASNLDPKTGSNTEKLFEEEQDYELIGGKYYYTSNESGVRYVYDDAKLEWLVCNNTGNENTHVVEDSEGRQYYTADGMYLCKDPGGTVYVMDENNEWNPWSQVQDKERWYFHKGHNSFYRDKASNNLYRLNKADQTWELYTKKRKKKHRNTDEEFDTDESDEYEEFSSDEEGDGSFPPGFNKDPSIVLEGSKYTKTDPSDNMRYEWDKQKKAWIPLVIVYRYNFI